MRSEVAQSCATEITQIMCDPMVCRLPGSFVRGTFLAKALEWAGRASGAHVPTAPAAAALGARLRAGGKPGPAAPGLPGPGRARRRGFEF